MKNIPPSIFLMCSLLSGQMSGCRNIDEKANDPSQPDSEQQARIPEVQQRSDSVLEVFNLQLKTLDEKIQLAKYRFSEMKYMGNAASRNKLRIIEFRRKKLIEEAIDLEKRPDADFAGNLSVIGSGLDLLSRDVDRLLKKAKPIGIPIREMTGTK